MRQIVLHGLTGEVYHLNQKIGYGSFGVVYSTQQSGLVAKISIEEGDFHEADVIQNLSVHNGCLKIIDRGTLE